jgi:hypothetical protein
MIVQEYHMESLLLQIIIMIMMVTVLVETSLMIIYAQMMPKRIGY